VTREIADLTSRGFDGVLVDGTARAALKKAPPKS